VHLLRHIL